MKQFNIIITTCLFLLFSSQAFAEDISEAEIFSGLINVSKDGTGFVRFKPCGSCNSIFLNITTATKTYINGVETGLLEARQRTKPGFVSLQYSPAEKEVLAIGFLK